MIIKPLSNEQARQFIDAAQIYEAWRAADAERRRRFLGGMRWAERKKQTYLLRKIGSRETSLGRRSTETEAAFVHFHEGRERNRDLLSGLAGRLNEMAPVNRAMGLGRVPRLAARILRDCDERELLGRQLYVVGTQALFAYEANAGVRLESGLLATGDIDLLLDARQRLSLAGRDIRKTGLLGLLQRLDHSFSMRRQGDFRAVNRDGYFVDLIRPQVHDVLADHEPAALSDRADDLQGVAIEGLGWLANAPRFSATAIAEDGFPMKIVTLDPRVFALHKAWLAERPDREPVKRGRDRAQAKAAALLAEHHLGLSFDDDAALSALPVALREMTGDLRSRGGESGPEKPIAPAW